MAHARPSSFAWLAIAAALLVAWAVALPHQPADLPDGVLTLAQGHRVVAEDYLLAADAPAAALVGSSMAAVLPKGALGPVRNLAFPGGSSLTGLELVAHSAQLPSAVFVEVNVLERPADTTLLDDVMRPAQLQLKAWCEPCRARNQPLTVALAALSRWRLPPTTEEERTRMNPPETMNAQAFEMQRREAAQPVDARWLSARLDETEKLVSQLTQRGVRVVFMELPVHPAIAAGPHQREVVAAARRRFPPGTYPWLAFAAREYATHDGVHLGFADARDIARVIAAAAAVEPRP